MQTTFNFYSDPGHGWVKVPIALLRELYIERKISKYSYVNNGNAYLEEDCDAGTFISAFMERNGQLPKFKEYNARRRDSKIRGYERYNPEAI
jgi:hypothetical protein